MRKKRAGRKGGEREEKAEMRKQRGGRKEAWNREMRG